MLGLGLDDMHGDGKTVIMAVEFRYPIATELIIKDDQVPGFRQGLNTSERGPDPHRIGIPAPKNIGEVLVVVEDKDSNIMAVLRVVEISSPLEALRLSRFVVF
jgi:hypothetical protein